MEFETNTTPVSDEQRRLAEAKKLTLHPVHSDVIAEENPEEAVSRHIAGPAIANAPNDTEQSSGAVSSPQKQPVESAKVSSPSSRSGTVVISAVIGVVGIITLTVLILTK